MSRVPGTQAERTRLAWSRSVLALLGLALLVARVLVGVDLVTALLVLGVALAAGVAALVLAARRHPRVRAVNGLRGDLDGRLPALVAVLAGVVGVGSLVLVLA
ncbi:DUF202 domain-containing protein [Nocardioides humi]|uniref:DUF202 domain-containing protein n=1 Tax=Nocardioides humi TaxID=449461 RepID=A0ABN2ASY8_9ACTN|nr:DUF202 domain-containing protein [Nocardioides humi]